MFKKTLSNIKTIFAAVIVVVIALCFGIIAFGCGNDDEDWHEYSFRIAKEEFGCVKILCYMGGSYLNEVSSVYKFDPDGYKRTLPSESAFDQPGGGTYVLGLDKFGYEMFIAIPSKRSTESNPKKYSPRLIQWPFAYSFTEIATFAAEYGYKYADGIDMDEDEENIIDFCRGSFGIINHNNINQGGNITEDFTQYFDDADKKYDELDVKFVMCYRVEQNEDGRKDYYITQESGKLVLYEEIRTQLENNTVIYSMSEVATRRRVDTGDAVRIARADFGCEKILWVDWVRSQNNVLESKEIPDGGCCVIGEDKDGNEVYVVVPCYITDKYKPSTFEWKFDYTFSQIARVFGKYGYKCVDGIDGMVDKYIHRDVSTYIDLIDWDDYVKSTLADYGDADELYEKLDVKFCFKFYKVMAHDSPTFLLMQQGGSLVVYETVNGVAENKDPTVYNKDNI